MLNIEEIISTALKESDTVVLRTARLLKSEIMKYKTSKDAKPYTDAIETQIIAKMCKQREESISQFKQAERMDLVQSEAEELKWLSTLLPAPVTVEDIKDYIESVYGEIPKKEMGIVIKHLKEKFPTADGKTLSDIVKSYLV